MATAVKSKTALFAAAILMLPLLAGLVLLICLVPPILRSASSAFPLALIGSVMALLPGAINLIPAWYLLQQRSWARPVSVILFIVSASLASMLHTAIYFVFLDSIARSVSTEMWESAHRLPGYPTTLTVLYTQIGVYTLCLPLLIWLVYHRKEAAV